MTKTVITLIVLVQLSFTLPAQTFEETLADAFHRFERTDTLLQKMNVVNRLDLIAARWPEQWTAHYYSAYTRIVVSYLLEDEKQRDGMIDQAEQALTKAKTLYRERNEEFYILDAYIASARISVKPGSRWKKYGAIFDASLEEAKRMNADNPRIYFLTGESLFYTPKAFGGGAKKALPYFEKASPLFMAAFKDKLDKPSWGQRMNEYYLSKCQ
jgi:tetratricopeptide (TPR) repeat protein